MGKLTLTSNISSLVKGRSERSIFNVGRVEVFVPSISSEPGNHPLPNLLLCSPNFADEEYLSSLVCGYHHSIVALLFLSPIDYPSCVLLYKFLGYEVMGYISHPKFLSSWMLCF